MKSTSLSVQFTVNDLSAHYEVLGTSDNYSFQYKLGQGNDLVDIVGETAVKIVPLHGNYGVFEIKVFAVSDIGIRSDFIIGEVEVNPPAFDQTFTFNNLRISDLRGGIKDSLFTEYSPSYQGDKLIVSQQFAGKNIELSWDLIPPPGHSLEGQSVDTELLSDTLFSGIIVDIKTGDQPIDLSTLNENNDAIQSFSRYLNTAASNVATDLDNYRNFSLVLDEDVFNGLNLPRDVAVDLVAVDKFGKTCTGTISGFNPKPVLNNLTFGLNGADMSFSWGVDSMDYSGMNINVLGIPEDRELFDSGDLINSKNFIDDLNNTISNNLTWDNNFNYSSGDLVLEDGDVYRSNADHSSSYNNRPSSNSVTWTNYGPSVDYDYNQASVSQTKFDQEQFFGYKYYYTFQIFDDFGPGPLLLLSEGGELVDQSEEGASLSHNQSEIKITNLRYFEREDDLVFNWDVVNQNGDTVDLFQYRGAFKEGGLPSILGLSGSLYDIHSNQIITGLTEGTNSISLTKNDDGDTEVSYGLQTSKIFYTYEYTRDVNNSIYGTGGFPREYEEFDYTKNYTSGDVVTISTNKIYKSILDADSEDPKIRPLYDQWNKQKDYAVGDSFVYDGKIYKVNQNFGPQYTQGLFNFSTNYISGDLVVSPNQYYEVFNSVDRYELNDLVVYNETLYRCLKFQETGSAATPGTDSSKWRVASLFSEVDCNVYKALGDSIGLIPLNQSVQENGSLVDKWEVYTPINSEEIDVYIESYPELIFEWETGVNFPSGSLTIYSNDIWSGVQDSGPDEDSGYIVPGTDEEFWVNQSEGVDIIFPYSSGDLVYAHGSVYKSESDNPVGAPLIATNQEDQDSSSSYQGTQWIPYWQNETQYEDIIFGNIGIPQSGKRSVGIELAIVDRRGQIFDIKKLDAENPAPVISQDRFDINIDSESESVKFNFNYLLGFQEKVNQVYLYRSSEPNFSIVDENGFPATGEGSSFVKSFIGAGDAIFGENVNTVIDYPDIPFVNDYSKYVRINQELYEKYILETTLQGESLEDWGKTHWENEGQILGYSMPTKQVITGQYNKLLPFDDFGTGVLHSVRDQAGNALVNVVQKLSQSRSIFF